MKKHFRKIIGASIIALLTITGCGSKDTTTSQADPAPSEADSEQETITIKVGHISPPEHSFAIGFDQFAKAVEEETNGLVQFEIYGNGQLGGERDLTEQVQLGTLDMTLVTSGPVANFAPMLGVLDMPFLFDDLDHVYSTLDGEVGNDLLAELSAAGFKGFAFWENGMRHFSNNKKEIRTPDDIKGLKMRTLENDIFVETYKALGADPTPIAFPEVYTSFQQGVVDGSDFSVGVFESTKQYEVQSHFSQAGIYYAAAVLMMNGEKFESLPSDIQEVFVRLGKEYASTQRQITQEMESEQIQTMKDNGVQVLDASELDLVAFKAAVEPVYTKYEDRFGNYIERIQSKQ